MLNARIRFATRLRGVIIAVAWMLAGYGMCSLMEMRTLAQWTIKPQLLRVPGVADVIVFGGDLKQFQIQADPALLRLSIDRGVNAMAFDAGTRQLLIPSGTDASLTVVKQSAADEYHIKGAVGTRPWAHNMVFDAKRRQVYLFAMDFTQPAPSTGQAKKDPLFHADTFSVLTLKSTRQAPMQCTASQAIVIALEIRGRVEARGGASQCR